MELAGRTKVAKVSILTRPEDRVHQGAAGIIGGGYGVSILTRPEDRVHLLE